LAHAGEEVALVLAAKSLWDTTGGELLERVRQLHPHAKRALLVQRCAVPHAFCLADSDKDPAVILAPGASYRRLSVPSLEALNGAGVFYGGPASEPHALTGKNVYIADGGNSAGQAALHLARYARRVTLVVCALATRCRRHPSRTGAHRPETHMSGSDSTAQQLDDLRQPIDPGDLGGLSLTPGEPQGCRQPSVVSVEA